MSDITIPYELMETPAASATGQSPWRLPSVRLTVMFAALTFFGMIMVASVARPGEFTPTVLKRLALTGVGIAVFAGAALTDYRRWLQGQMLVLSASLMLLVVVLLMGLRINGARRWLDIGLPVNVQPSEFAKVALCIWVAAYCHNNADRMQSFVQGFMAPMCTVGLACLLILAEPDFGTAVLTGAVCIAVLLAMGTRLLYAIPAGIASLPVLYKLVMGEPYRARRILAFLNPEADPLGAGYQIIQSTIAIGSGGLTGLGAGAGMQKAGFLPGTDNDFVFAVLAEEFGFIGCVIVIAVFMLILWEALKVVMRSREPFGFALALGLSVLLGLQAAVHIAVVTGSVPNKGLSLPFVSAGGSSLLASMWAAGLLVSIARSQEKTSDFTRTEVGDNDTQIAN